MMKKITALITVLLMSFFTACGGLGQEQTEGLQMQIEAMNTFMTVTAYGAETKDLEAARDEIKRLEALFSVTDEKSEICSLNRDKKADISEDTEYVIKKALEVADSTDGALDITVYPVVKEWGFTTGDYKIPSDAKINELLESVDWERVQLSDGEASIDEKAEIDLGSIVKGYTGDVLAKLLRDAGVESALLDLGGNIQTVGPKPDGSKWRLAVRDPFTTGSAGVLEVENKAVITSGNYERNFTGDDGKLYWHIIDPETGRPAESGVSSVTIVCDEGVYGDALSTALFVMGAEKGLEYWRENQGFEAIFITDSGEIIITEGIEKDFAPEEGFSVTTARK